MNGICPDSNYTTMYGTIPEWNTAEITDMSNALEDRSEFTGDLRRWQGHDTVIALRIQSESNQGLPIRCPPRSVYKRGAQMTHGTRFHKQKNPAFAPGGETSSLHTACAETPRHRDRPGENTPHVRSYPAHAYPMYNVATACKARIRIRAGSRFPNKMPNATGGITRRATRSMGRKRVRESAGDATQRKRAVQRENLARRAEQSAQTAHTIASYLRRACCDRTQIVIVFSRKYIYVHGPPTSKLDLARTESLSHT
jgi:hypothetical protein